MKICHACGESWDGSPGAQPGRSETCAQCGADLHCCLNCKLFDPQASGQCSSRTTEPVKDKDKGNYCDEFELGARRESAKDKSGDMENKWKDLFN